MKGKLINLFCVLCIGLICSNSLKAQDKESFEVKVIDMATVFYSSTTALIFAWSIDISFGNFLVGSHLFHLKIHHLTFDNIVSFGHKKWTQCVQIYYKN